MSYTEGFQIARMNAFMLDSRNEIEYDLEVKLLQWKLTGIMDGFRIYLPLIDCWI